MTNTEKKLRDEWSQEVDKEMPSVLIVDGEKEIADWWLNKIAQERERVENILDKYYAYQQEDGSYSFDPQCNQLIDTIRDDLLSSLKEKDL